MNRVDQIGLAVLAVLTLSLANGYAQKKPAGDDPFAGLGNGIDGPNELRQATLILEQIEIDRADWNRWISDSKNSTDGPELREYVLQLFEKDKATIVDITIAATESGRRARAGSYRAVLYPSEYGGPGELAEEGARFTHMNPVAFETRYVGVLWEFDLQLGPEPGTFAVSLSGGRVLKTGETASGKVPNRVHVPMFYTARITTGISGLSGKSYLLGNIRPDQSVEGSRTDPVVLCFVRVDEHQFADPKNESKKEEE